MEPFLIGYRYQYHGFGIRADAFRGGGLIALGDGPQIGMVSGLLIFSDDCRQ